MTLTDPTPSIILMVRDASGRHCYKLAPQWRAGPSPATPSTSSSSGRSSVSTKSFAPRVRSQLQEPVAPDSLVVSHADISGFLLLSTELTPPVVQRTRSLSFEKQSQLLDRMCKQQLEVEQAHGLAMVRSCHA